MHYLQPNQLKDYFLPLQENIMQEDIKSYFKGPIKPGIHLVMAEYPGKLTDYYVSFLVEQPFNPRPFIIMVCVEAKCNTSRKRFEKDVDKIAAKADDLPERKAALMLNIQTQFT
jgi:hypothetical protein